MFDNTIIDNDIAVIVEELADSRLCIFASPESFERRVLEDVAVPYSIGVTNVMGKVYQSVAGSDRFNPTRKQAILVALTQRGVGTREPLLKRF